MIRYLLVLCLFQLEKAHAFFSKTYDFGDVNYVYSSSIVFESDTSAICYTTSQMNKIWAINFSRIDLRNGNILLTKQYDFHPSIIQGSVYLSLFKSKYFEGYYAAFNIGDSTFKNVQTIFIKLNMQLDTLLTFRTDTSFIVGGNNIVEGLDSCIYFVGGHYYANNSDSCQTTLFKFNSNGKRIFQKFFNIPFIYDFGICMDFDSKRNIYLSSITNFFSVKLNRLIQHPIIFKLSSNGDLINFKDFGAIDTEECGWYISILNDTIFAGGCNSERFIKVVDTNLQMCNKFSVIGTGDSLKDVGFLKLKFNQTGYIIMAATADKPYVKNMDGKYYRIRMGGYVGKMNRFNGEILWERMYSCNPDTEGVNYIAGLNITPSNEILIIGSGLKKVNGDYKNLDWILYLDSNGCLSNTECGEWSRVPVSSSVSSQSKSTIKIFPNPLNNYCIIQQEKQSQKATYQITNMKGQMVQEGNLESDQTRIQTDLWPSGMYLIQIKREDEIYIERIVKE